MKLCVCHAAIWVLLLVIAVVPGNCAKNNKIKIIVPHKINYVHYHPQPSPHPRISEPFYLDQLRNENEDESGEEYENASDDIYDMHEDLEEPGKDFSYYTMLKTRFSHAPAVKPVFTYGSFNKFKYPTAHAVVRYSDYPDRKRRNSEKRPSIYFDY